MRKRIVLFLVIILFLSTIVVSTVSANQIHVWVYDGKGNPIENAKVTFIGVTGGGGSSHWLPYSRWTNETGYCKSGFFEINDQCYYYATKAGYHRSELRYETFMGQSSSNPNRDIYLEKRWKSKSIIPGFELFNLPFLQKLITIFNLVN